MATAPPARFDAHLHLSRYWPEIATNSYGPSVDHSLEGLLREMDAVGIAEGLLIQINESPGVAENLAEGEELFRRSGGRLHRTSTVDPTRATEAVPDAVRAWEAAEGLVALKLFPGYQHFYPHDRRLDPLYEFAARTLRPVLLHQGDTLDRRGLVKFARPLEVDEVAVRFPEVPFVLCHMGNPWFEECTELLYKDPNVYADTSGLLPPLRSPRFSKTFDHVRRKLQEVVDGVGDVSKILYGSDWPLEELRTAVALVESLDLTGAEREAVLGGNARRLLGIPPPKGGSPSRRASAGAA